MRFALRCIIILALLYAAILRHDGYLVDPAQLAQSVAAVPPRAAADMLAAAGPQIAARAESYCRHDPAACLAGAAALAGPLGVAPVPRRNNRVTLGASTP